jgi:hypothetical protein
VRLTVRAMVAFNLPDGQERKQFSLGWAASGEVQNLIRRLPETPAALEGVWEYWNRTLGAVNVDTPILP